MKIKAKYFDRNVTIIDFINTTGSNITKAIYIDENGNIDTCFLGVDNHLVVVDNEYLPKGESKITGWCDMRG